MTRIDRYEKSDREEVFHFLRAAHPETRSTCLIQQWVWKYDDNPFNPKGEPYILLLRKSGKTVGMLGATPVRIAIEGREHQIINSTDLVVHPAFRGRGFGKLLVARTVEENPVSISWTNQSAYRVSRFVETSHFFRVPLLVRFLKPGQRAGSAMGGPWVRLGAGFVERLARTLIFPFNRFTQDSENRVTEVGNFVSWVDDFWEKVVQNYAVIVVRDQRYLNWRISGRPDARYRILQAVRRDRLVGYLVLRSVTRRGRRYGYLVDYLVEKRDLSALSALVGHAAEILRSEGATVMVLRVSPAHKRAFYRLGFFPLWGPRFGYFQVRVNQPDPPLERLIHPEQWFLTMADGDLEMAD